MSPLDLCCSKRSHTAHILEVYHILLMNSPRFNTCLHLKQPLFLGGTCTPVCMMCIRAIQTQPHSIAFWLYTHTHTSRYICNQVLTYLKQAVTRLEFWKLDMSRMSCHAQNKSLILIVCNLRFSCSFLLWILVCVKWVSGAWILKRLYCSGHRRTT